MQATLLIAVAAVICCFSFTQPVKAVEGTTIYGTSSTEYDEASNWVTVQAATELNTGRETSTWRV